VRHVHFGIGSLALQRALRNRIAQAQGAEYRRAAGCRDFAREVKGVDLRSTASNCAWVGASDGAKSLSPRMMFFKMPVQKRQQCRTLYVSRGRPEFNSRPRSFRVRQFEA